jgi:hypothetical protein
MLAARGFAPITKVCAKPFKEEELLTALSQQLAGAA